MRFPLNRSFFLRTKDTKKTYTDWIKTRIGIKDNELFSPRKYEKNLTYIETYNNVIEIMMHMPS